jgi:hypothetical protein
MARAAISVFANGHSEPVPSQGGFAGGYGITALALRPKPEDSRFGMKKDGNDGAFVATHRIIAPTVSFPLGCSEIPQMWFLDM